MLNIPTSAFTFGDQRDPAGNRLHQGELRRDHIDDAEPRQHAGERGAGLSAAGRIRIDDRAGIDEQLSHRLDRRNIRQRCSVATPTPTRARSTRLPGRKAPAFSSASMAGAGSTITSGVSPAASFCRMTAGAPP